MSDKQNDVLSVLISALGDTDSAVRYAAAEVLADQSHYCDASELNVVVNALVRVLNDKGVNVRMAAIRTLEQIEPECNDRLMSGLTYATNDDNGDVRASAVRALGIICCQMSIVPTLISAMSDEDWHVREMAVRALGRCKKDE